MALVAFADAKRHLKIPDAETRDDADITTKLAEATEAIVVYLKTADPLWDETTTPPDIQAAVKLMLTHLWDFRGDVASGNDAAEKVWKAIELLLYRRRTPALA